jgi:hypothetical protein
LQFPLARVLGFGVTVCNVRFGEKAGIGCGTTMGT